MKAHYNAKYKLAKLKWTFCAQFHLVKCRRNHPNSDIQICAFNTSHHVPAASMEEHLATCQDRCSSIQLMLPS